MFSPALLDVGLTLATRYRDSHLAVVRHCQQLLIWQIRLHISPTDTPSMQNLILEGLQQKLQKSCSRCNKNTRHIESSYILQPPKYLLLFVNRFRYLNNNIIKDRCPIPLDATVMLGPLKFNLQATIDHHGPSIDSGHYTASINCCKKTFYCNDHKITEFGITDKNSSTAYIVLYKWIDT